MENPHEKSYKNKLEEFTPEDVKEIMENPCKGRGEHILTLEREAKKLGGQGGFLKLKNGMEKLGYPIKFEKIDPLGWYPAGYKVLGMIVLKDVLNLKAADIADIGARAVNFSFIVKFFFKYFRSRRVAFNNVFQYWKKHFNCGELKPIEYHEKDKDNYLIIRQVGFKTHPIYCEYFLGYFLQLSKLLGIKAASIEETKCVFRGDTCNEFLIRWK